LVVSHSSLGIVSDGQIPGNIFWGISPGISWEYKKGFKYQS